MHRLVEDQINENEQKGQYSPDAPTVANMVRQALEESFAEAAKLQKTSEVVDILQKLITSYFPKGQVVNISLDNDQIVIDAIEGLVAPDTIERGRGLSNEDLEECFAYSEYLERLNACENESLLSYQEFREALLEKFPLCNEKTVNLLYTDFENGNYESYNKRFEELELNNLEVKVAYDFSNECDEAKCNAQPTVNTQAHYKGSESLYKFADDWGLNAYEFDLIKRIVRCRHKGSFAQDLMKTKDLIYLYLQEQGENFEPTANAVSN